MPRKKKNQKKSKKTSNYLTICVIICAVLLLAFLGVVLYKLIFTSYKVTPRTQKITEETKKRSEEVIGWIKVQGTNIDYPVIYNSEDVDIEREIGDFAWMNTKIDKLTNRPIIYGHNLRNISSHPDITNKGHTRFEQLLSFLYPSFVKNNKYIQFTIDGKDYVYKIFSISIAEIKDINIDMSSLTKKEMKEYIAKSKKDSYFKFNVDVDTNDGIITLVTCTRFFGPNTGYDFKIDARLVRNGEMLSNYGFKEKNNYKTIDKILKGDEANEKA